MKYSAIIPAGGSSSRYGQGNKLFQILNGKPVFLHAVEQFRIFCKDQYIVIPVHKDQKEELLEDDYEKAIYYLRLPCYPLLQRLSFCINGITVTG